MFSQNLHSETGILLDLLSMINSSVSAFPLVQKIKKNYFNLRLSKKKFRDNLIAVYKYSDREEGDESTGILKLLEKGIQWLKDKRFRLKNEVQIFHSDNDKQRWE